MSSPYQLRYISNPFQVHPEKMRQALTMDVLATDLADYLVRKGVSGYRSYGMLLHNGNPDTVVFF